MMQIHDRDTHCNYCHVKFPICVASGKPIYDSIYFTCSTCQSKANEEEMRLLKACPLVR